MLKKPEESEDLVFKCEIRMMNDAFYGQGAEMEIIRILEDLRYRIESGGAEANHSYNLRDINGNTVGRAYFEGKR